MFGADSRRTVEELVFPGESVPESRQREARGVDHYAAAVNEHIPYHRAPDEELQL